MTSRQIVWLCVLAVALALGVVLLRPREPVVEVVTVQRMSIVQSVVATGRVNTPARIELGAEITAAVQEVRVAEGDRVRSGQTVLRLRDEEARAALAQARASLVESQTRLNQLDTVGQPVSAETLTQAQTNLRNAQADHLRVQALVEQGFYPRQRMDDAQRALDNARSVYAAAQAQARATLPGGVERELALAHIGQARAAADAAQARLARTTISSPVDAIVLNRSAEPGALAQPGRVLLLLAATGATRIDAHVDEKHLSLLRPGLAARVLADAWPAEPFDAKLDFVSPAVDAQRGTVEVRLLVDRPPAFVRPDMTVSVEMMVGSRERALVLPADAVRDADSAAPWVLVVRDGVARRTALKLGLRGVGSVEVLEGLNDGDVAVVAGAAAADGDRVKARARGSRARGLEIPSGLAQ